jgi:hypothetical protein
MTMPGFLDALVDDPAQFAVTLPADPLLSRRPAQPLRALMDFGGVNEFLRTSALGLPFVSMAKDGERIPPERYAPGLGTVNVALVAAELEAGTSLQLHELHHAWPPLVAACRRLEHDLGAPVTADAFIAPAKAQCLTHHYDNYSVFAIQTEGSKTWQLFRPVLPFPLTDQKWRKESVSPDDWHRLLCEPPDYQYTLRPGDVLWVPRGWIHNAVPTDEPSMHVAIGVAETSRHALVRTIICDALAREEAFRRDLPVGYARSAASSEDTIRGLLRALADWAQRADTARLAAGARSAAWSGLRGPTPEPVSPAVTGIESPLPDAVLVMPEAICGIDTADDHLTLHLGDRVLTFAGTARAVVERLLAAAGTAVAVEGIGAAGAGETVAAVVRLLVTEGVAVPAGPVR